MKKYDIKSVKYNTIEYKQELELRNEILRKPLGLSILEDDLSADINDIHIGVFEREEILACLIITLLNNYEVKIRQVAVKKEYQGMGIGKDLIIWTEKYLKNRNYTRVFLNARVQAIKFYEKLDYKIYSDEFFEIGILHKKMTKIIKCV